MPSVHRTVSPTASCAPGVSSVPEPSVNRPSNTSGTGRQYAVVAVLALVLELGRGGTARRRHEGTGEQEERNYCPTHTARRA